MWVEEIIAEGKRNNADDESIILMRPNKARFSFRCCTVSLRLRSFFIGMGGITVVMSTARRREVIQQVAKSMSLLWRNLLKCGGRRESNPPTSQKKRFRHDPVDLDMIRSLQITSICCV